MRAFLLSSHVLVSLGLVSALVPGCRSNRALHDREVDHKLVRIAHEQVNLRRDTVGHDQWTGRATFALIDAHNEHDRDLLVTLGGEFVDAQGATVGTARAESLRIPAGGVRTFALIDREQAELPQAVTVRAEVLGAYVPNYTSSVQVTDGAVYRYDNERIVVNGVVRNAADRPVKVIVLSGFYDADDKPLTRPFTEMYLPADGKSNAQFPGPPGAVKGYIFIGDMVY